MTFGARVAQGAESHGGPRPGACVHLGGCLREMEGPSRTTEEPGRLLFLVMGGYWPRRQGGVGSAFSCSEGSRSRGRGQALAGVRPGTLPHLGETIGQHRPLPTAPHRTERRVRASAHRSTPPRTSKRSENGVFEQNPVGKRPQQQLETKRTSVYQETRNPGCPCRSPTGPQRGTKK